MLNRRWIMATLMMVAALPMMAQGPRGGRPGGNSVDFLAGYLSLTEAQKTQAKTIFDAAATAGESTHGTLTAAHDALKAAVKLNKSDAELDRLAAAVGAVEGQLAAIHAKASAKLYNLLTPEQKTKYDTMAAHRGPGGPGGMRP